MKNHRKKRLLIAVIALFFFLVSLIVILYNPKVDPSFLTGIPCSVPCWQEITPGRSTEIDVIQALSNLETVKQDSISKNHSSVNDSIVFYDFVLRGGVGGVSLENDVVDGIRLAGIDILLEEVITVFGEPEILLTRGHALCFEVDFFYLSQGMWFDGRRCESQFRTPATGVEIEPDIELYALQLFVPKQSEDVEVFMRDVVKVHPDYAKEIATCGEKWIGFTIYSVPCSPLFGG